MMWIYREYLLPPEPRTCLQIFLQNHFQKMISNAYYQIFLDFDENKTTNLNNSNNYIKLQGCVEDQNHLQTKSKERDQGDDYEPQKKRYRERIIKRLREELWDRKPLTSYYI